MTFYYQKRAYGMDLYIVQKGFELKGSFYNYGNVVDQYKFSAFKKQQLPRKNKILYHPNTKMKKLLKPQCKHINTKHILNEVGSLRRHEDFVVYYAEKYNFPQSVVLAKLDKLVRKGFVSYDKSIRQPRMRRVFADKIGHPNRQIRPDRGRKK